MTELWWLSFCDTDKPVGQKFTGVAVVEVPSGSTIVDAVDKAWETGCNPGGQVWGYITETSEDVPKHMLLTKDNLEALEIETVQKGECFG